MREYLRIAVARPSSSPTRVWSQAAGTNDSSISVTFNNLGGSIEVDTGTLTLANSGTSLNGTFIVAAGAALD